MKCTYDEDIKQMFDDRLTIREQVYTRYVEWWVNLHYE
jgi:hypothetical protein